MNLEIRVPSLPESVTDATVLAWHKQPGERVKRDENLVDLETDKVVLEVPSPTDGILTEILAASGHLVEADDVLGSIEPESPEAKPASHVEEIAHAAETVLTPSVRRLVKEMNLDPSSIQGTGKDGRILKSDVLRHIDQQTEAAPATPSPEKESPAVGNQRLEKRVPMSRLRARIAERLVQVQQSAAILTTFNEVNLQAVKDLRASQGDAFEKAHGVRLGFMSFFVKAVLAALRKFPLVNASIDGQDIIYHDYYDIGIAVGSSRGLVVPVLRNADQLDFAGIEQAIKSFAQKADAGTLTYEELSGGTFSITNGGVYGSMMSTPIINPPQSAILGMHKIIDRPMAENGLVVIRPMMYLALSYDHRIIDGKDAVSFLVMVKNNLENPARMLLGV